MSSVTPGRSTTAGPAGARPRNYRYLQLRSPVSGDVVAFWAALSMTARFPLNSMSGLLPSRLVGLGSTTAAGDVGCQPAA